MSLGQIGFFGIGAAVAGHLSADRGFDLVAAVLLAGLAGAAAAVLIGLPALRISGLFLAVVTVSFSITVSRFVLNPEFVHWIPTGPIERTPLFGRISVASETAFYLFCVAVFTLVLGSVRSVRASRFGRAMIAVRENQRGVQSYGVNATSVKLAAFAFSGFLAALAGAMFVHHQGTLGISAYGVDESREAFIQVVIGGLGSVPGAILGTGLIQGIDWFKTAFPVAVRPLLTFLTSGVGLILVLLVLPGGFSDLYYRARTALLRRVAARHRVEVPSLVADRAVRPEGAVPALPEPLPVPEVAA